MRFSNGKIKVCEYQNKDKTYDIVTDDGFAVACNVMYERAKQIVEAVNKHDNLVAEVEKLKKDNRQLKERYPKFPENDIVPQCADCRLIYDRCFQEINHLKEALKKCDPFIAVTGSRLHVCEFCFDNPHTEDCEYIKLIGGEGE